MKRLKYRKQFCTYAIASSLILGSCGKDSQNTYTIPKETAPAFSMPTQPSPRDEMAKMAQGTVPTAGSSDLPSWSVPETWTVGQTSSMRKGAFSYSNEAGDKIEIVVTVFPGDVGGLLANVNRWAGQIQLPPFDAASIKSATKSENINGSDVTIVDINNANTQNGILAAIFKKDGNSWFFKASGNSAVISEQTETFMEFIRSVDFQ